MSSRGIDGENDFNDRACWIMLALQISKPLDGVIVADDMAFDTGHVGSLRVVALTLLTARRALLAAPCTERG